MRTSCCSAWFTTSSSLAFFSKLSTHCFFLARHRLAAALQCVYECPRSGCKTNSLSGLETRLKATNLFLSRNFVLFTSGSSSSGFLPRFLQEHSQNLYHDHLVYRTHVSSTYANNVLMGSLPYNPQATVTCYYTSSISPLHSTAYQLRVGPRGYKRHFSTLLLYGGGFGWASFSHLGKRRGEGQSQWSRCSQTL